MKARFKPGFLFYERVIVVMWNGMVDKSRQAYLDVIRLISCMLVVFVHVSAIDWNNIPVNSLDWNVLNIFNCLGMNGVALFFMISGALILNKEYQITLKKLFINKIGKLLMLYYITLFCYNLLPFLRGWAPLEIEILKENLLEATIYEIGVYHLWFIPVLIILYLLSPVLRESFKSKKICEYYLILFTIIGAFLPTLLIFDLPGALKRFISYYQGKASLFMLTGYIGYFVLGHYLHSYASELSKKNKIIIWIVTLSSLAFTIFTCFAASVKQGSPSSLTNTPLSINMLLSSSGIYLLLKHYASKISSEKLVYILSKSSKYTLGIYILHPFVLSNFPIVDDLNKVIDGVFLLTITRVIVVTVITFILVYVLKKIPVLNKIL